MHSKKNNWASVSVHWKMVLLVLTFFQVISVAADPVNFMVGPLTFTRPPQWIWKDPDPGTKAAADLQIIDPETHADAHVLFSFSPSTPESVVKRWKGYFAEPPTIVSQITTNHVQSFNVTHLSVTGTLRTKLQQRPNFSLVGIIVETEKGNVYGRLLGPKNLVQKLTVEFKKMVEAALNEN